MLLYIIIIALPLAFYLYIKWRYTYWQKKGVFNIEPKFPSGSMTDVMKGKIGNIDFYTNFYTDLKKRGLKYGGLYSGLGLVFVPIDQELIKHILLKDFEYFVDHGLYSNPKSDLLTGGLFFLEGEQWRNHRAKLTPTFTSGKMKMMFHTLVTLSKSLEKLLAKEAERGESIFIKEILARFTTDIIGSVAFGINCNCMEEPDNEFRQNCNKAFGIHGKWKQILYVTAPKWFLRAINFKQTDPNVEGFFFNLVENTIKYREENNVFRKDFLQMLIELKNTGTINEADTVHRIKQISTTPFFSLSEIVAHSFAFFLAGFETSSTTMSFAIVELGINQDVQDKLRKEILEVLARYNGELTYEAINEMTYLEQVIQETLRKYPPIPIVPRECTKTYKVPGENLVIEKGTKVQIAVNAIQHDPEYFPNPEKFDPDRWSSKNAAKISNFHFLAFGEGPRICIASVLLIDDPTTKATRIGMRFGKLQTKCGIITLLKNYKLTLGNKMQVPIKLGRSFMLTVEGGVWVDLEKLDK